MITVFTPTYNRVNLLQRCYESLERQSCKDFEWLIVDDGSTDETKELIERIKKKSGFKILYYYQKNGGKHRAFNRAVNECGGEYFLILDSDDVLAEDAIEILMKKIYLIKNKDNISGIIGNRGFLDKDGIIGVRMPKVRYASGLELYQRMGLRGDTLRMYKTSILKDFPFPEVKGETFMPENVVFDKIDKKYKMLVISEILYLGEYQEAGLTNNVDKLKCKNPIGYSLSLKSTAENALTLKKKIGVTLIYIIWNKKFHVDGAFYSFKNKALYMMCIPISLVMSMIHRPVFLFDSFKEGGCG